MRKKNIVCLILALTMVLTGCNHDMEAGEYYEYEEVKLMEPEDDPADWEEVRYRNLYDANIYSATVYPQIEEYSFGKDVVLDRYNAYLGDSVSKGEVLAYADNSSLKAGIVAKEEEIAQMEKDFQEYIEEMEEKLYEPELEVKRLKDIVEAYEKAKPDEFLPEDPSVSGWDAGPDISGGNDADGRIKNPDYLIWEEAFHVFEGEYRILAHDVDTARKQMEQRTRLYEWDHEYALKQLESMKAELEQGVLKASAQGTVVAVSSKGNGGYFSRKDAVLAVGCLQEKLLRCEYINKLTAAGAKDIYALIDGRRYEVSYQPMDAEEYAKLAALNEKVYSTFELTEEVEDVSVGDFAVIVLINDYREGVLTVPANAIHRSAAGPYVHVRDGESSIQVNVETGFSDGVYTEILAGLKEHDLVMVPDAWVPGSDRAVIKTGSISGSFRGNGYLQYPLSSVAANPVKYGTVYFVEYTKNLYEHVDKGDVIATIRVEEDNIELQRNRVKLERLKERLDDLEKEGAGANQKVITARREEIARVQELIDDMAADYSATQIRADSAGIIVNMIDYDPEDILAEGAQLVEIANEDTCYIVLENKNQLLQYGGKVTVSYNDRSGEARTADGMVANLSGVSRSLKTEYSYVLLSPEVIGDMAAASVQQNGWMTRNTFQVDALIREMDGILLVPRDAVWETRGRTYVFVVEEDGSIVSRSFIAGGYNSSWYWVVDGLTEGMEICLK